MIMVAPQFLIVRVKMRRAELVVGMRRQMAALIEDENQDKQEHTQQIAAGATLVNYQRSQQPVVDQEEKKEGQ